MEKINNNSTKSNKNDDNHITESKNELNPITTSNNIINNNISNNDNNNNNGSNDLMQESGGTRRTRRAFTDLSQEDADLALARTLQEQERAYMMLSMSADGIPYGSWGAAGYVHEDDDEDFNDPSEEEYDGSDVDDDEDEDAFDVHAHMESGEGEHQGAQLDPSAYPNDEAYARALQDAEERVMATRLMALAGINDVFVRDVEHINEEDEDEDDDDEDEDENDGDQDSQDAWEEVDPDEMTYEELIALGEVVGTQSRGLPSETIASLPTVNYKSKNTQEGSSDPCVICRCDYEDGETLTVLSCKHSYHSECVNNWLLQNKVCPICNAEVSTSGNI
ncbi:hypothetical protein Leryth_009267 [Lithospermum erythrorhizon]|nr:hypothetical protein Leryth_009267 [Lithospermum erythrorhizon]